jgi:RNA polymerase sigma-70 factor (ECF subfamily)
MTEQDQSPNEDEARWAAYMRASQAGDGEAFESLLKEILPRIRSRVFGRLGGREHAEDVVQNVLLSIHRSRHTYQPTRPFKPWLNAVTRNAVIDAVRARRNEWRHQSFDEREVPGEDPPIPGASESLSPELENALSRLPKAQREAVELLHIQQLSVREAASKTGSSIGAFKVRAHRGRVRLREILTGRKA